MFGTGQVERLQKRIIKLEKEVVTDELTGLLNRRGLMRQLEPIFQAAKFEHNNPEKRHGVIISTLSVVMVDLDKFKSVNDTYGHLAGDEALKKVSQIIMEDVRGLDVVGRLGGEELVIGLLGANLEQAERIADKIRQAIEESVIVLERAKLRITASFGVAEMENDSSLTALIDRADRALYQAKDSGRNRVVVAKNS